MSCKSTITDRIYKDFQRDVYCLLGLPVDNLTLQATKDALWKQKFQEESVVLATINVNWVVKSFSNPLFRAAIINSDMVSLDGRPLLWLAKLLGYPMTEVVAGSTLIEELRQEENTKEPFSLFLFGGDVGVAKQAMERVNKEEGCLHAVGALDPGFGSVEEMSRSDIIETINKVEPDILLVALGAEKGAGWIEYNRSRLNAKVISHLGATINFLAGTVCRAPKLLRATAMEWVWRILQEPKLFTRYASDGLVILCLVVGRFLLWRQFLSWQKQCHLEQPDNTITQQERSDEIVLSFGRNVLVTNDFPVREIFGCCVRSCKNITLDFQKTEFVDGTFMGLLLLLEKHQLKNGNKLNFINVHGKLGRLFRFFCVHGFLNNNGK